MAKAVRNVFVNCPFDSAFGPLFQAIVFSTIACGFNVRCAREMDDASESRIDKLYRIIEQSRFGIHDLSRTELDLVNHLPRFNMPLELGIFLGCKRFGDDENKLKRCLILDVEQFRYQKFISDLAGSDIRAHDSDPREIVSQVRDWLMTVSRRKSIPSTQKILSSYDAYCLALPDLADRAGLNLAVIAYPDFERLTLSWVKSYRELS